MQPNQHTKEVVVLSGYSGTGKSALALDLKKRIASMKGRGAFVVGKFGQHHSGEPLSAISKAFGELCHRVILLDNEEEESSICKEIEQALHEELQDEVHLLARIIPNLNEIITADAHSTSTSMSDNETVDSDARQAKFKYALRVFIRIMSSYISPLVICLDDLQWADVSSLEVIDLLASDALNKNPLMIIGSYRSNE
eukprot:10837327-Ditylum_brightwellii.AAC.1